MSSELRKRSNATASKKKKTKADQSPDSNSTGTDTLVVDYPSGKPQDNESSPKTAAVVVNKGSSSASFILRFLQGYSSFMTKGINQDRGLKILQYTLWVFSYLSKRKNAIIGDSCKKLYNEVSFARYVLRLFGLPDAIEATISGSWCATSKTNPRLHKILGQIMTWSMIGYYPLEHLAYIQWQTPKLLFFKTKSPIPTRFAEKMSAWSCRCWCIYIVAEIVQCVLKVREETQLLQQQRKTIKEIEENKGTTNKTKIKSDSSNSDDEGDNMEQLALVVKEKQNSIKSLKLQIIRDILFSLPAIHWSLPNWDTDPWLAEPFVNILMWLESVVCMYQSISSFQQQQ